ncbi:hypothetical protein DPMN_056022 [Dreissena polymorpha]|uniref:Uncharacterized protein n=1 Tax=Dreissena polymorpha TaxID=45954 RepID=A0A9D4HSS8_DREPO|nr:hypothetical protein DPMN_056022 [Dreissena polymorpha]
MNCCGGRRGVMDMVSAKRPGGHGSIPTVGACFRSTPKTPNIIGTNLLTKFHEDRKINVASRVLTRKNAPPSGSHVFQPTGISFELIQYIIGMNLLTKFHEDRTVDVASRVLTRFYYSHLMKNSLPPGGHVFQPTGIIFELVQDIIGMNLLTKVHEDQTINEKCPSPWQPCFSSKHIIKTNLLTKFHEDWTINVASRDITEIPNGNQTINNDDFIDDDVINVDDDANVIDEEEE